MELHETVMGKQFFHGTMPAINRNLEDIASSLNTICKHLEHKASDPQNQHYIVLWIDPINNDVDVLKKVRFDRNTFTYDEAFDIMVEKLRQLMKEYGLTEASPEVQYGDYAAEIRISDTKQDFLHIIAV